MAEAARPANDADESGAIASMERSLRFGPYTFDASTGELRRDGEIVELAPQPTQLLGLLVAKPGRLVTRDELRRQMWPDTIVEFDHALNTCIRAIRVALGESAAEPVFVQTVPRRGYRFIAEVEAVDRSDAPHQSGNAAESTTGPSVRRSFFRHGAWLLVAVLVAVALGVLWLRSREAPVPRLAILGFENLSPAVIPDYQLTGLAEEIVLSVARNEPADLVVITRASAEAVGAHNLDELARLLRASHVVTGTARSTGDGLVVTASLSRLSDHSVLWADRYDRTADAFAGEVDEIARAISGMLATSLGGVAPGPVAPTKPATRATLLRARYLLGENRAADAIDLITTTVSDQDRLAMAQAILARARIGLGDTIGARQAADRAVALDSTLAEGHVARAELATRSWWQWTTATREYEAALRLEPGRAEFHHSYAYLLSILGRHRAAIREIELALDLDPVSPVVNGDLAWLHFFAGDDEGAIRQAETTLDLVPHFIPAMHCLMLALERDGRTERARQVAASIARAQAVPADILHRIETADPSDALQAFWEWFITVVKTGDDGDSAYVLGYAYTRTGEPDSAFLYLGQAVQQRSHLVPALGVDPRYEPLRADPRFATYLGKMGLPR